MFQERVYRLLPERGATSPIREDLLVLGDIAVTNGARRTPLGDFIILSLCGDNMFYRLLTERGATSTIRENEQRIIAHFLLLLPTKPLYSFFLYRKLIHLFLSLFTPTFLIYNIKPCLTYLHHTRKHAPYTLPIPYSVPYFCLLSRLSHDK
jgi:hypothetical protein